MKNYRTELQNSLSNNSARFCFCIKIERLDGQILRLTTFDENLKINRNWDGTQVNNQNEVIYYPDKSGIDDRKAINYKSGTEPSVLDLTATLEPNGIDRDSLQSGKWDFSSIKLFRTLWDDPVEDDDPLMEARFGSIKIEDSRFKTKLNSLSSILETTIGRSHQPTCDATLGDNRCKVDLPSFEVSGTLESVSNNGLEVTDSSRTESDDFYGLGELRIDSGPNSGTAAQIKDFENGVFTLWEPFYYQLEGNESYRAVPGCRKRFEPDCRDKFNNAKNHQGFFHMPTSNDTSQFGAQ